ncbi:hypothetical protein GGX14DRAFT_699955 [Mycena pura]|uniref:Uncharacterized protein n=1 Tax=Mycena pura TaxID=153505 RepID=A0AAD6V3U8_9AGAR|nr:hypothetical protein GGX14DRAFT_699955 [Mycena pura]
MLRVGRSVYVPNRVIFRRKISSEPTPLPREFQALLQDEREVLHEQRKVPLDAVVNELASEASVNWANQSPRRDTKDLARDIRACILASDVPAALAILSTVPRPYPRLLAHTAVHALLRIRDIPHAGALMLEFATERATTKLPRMHPTTLARTTMALLELVPRAQAPQAWSRTAQNPDILQLTADKVSHPSLRTAYALYVQARRIFVRRKNAVAEALWRALLIQREWVAAALMFELQVKDYQLRRTLPSLLNNRNPDGLLTPHDRDHARRRLALLRLEQARPSYKFFSQLCHRLGNVISKVTSGLTEHPSTVHHIQLDPVHCNQFVPNIPFKASSGLAISSSSGRPLSHRRAQHHARLALQALTIIGALIDNRKIPFSDVSAWVITVGSLPPVLAPIQSYASLNGRSIRVTARSHLRAVLEAYASALPRSPHVYSEFIAATGGLIRRGLHHKVASSNIFNERERKIRALRERRRAETDSAAFVVSKYKHVPPDDPVDACDDSLMPPPNMATCEALLGVFLHSGNGCGLLYCDHGTVPSVTVASAEQSKSRDVIKSAGKTLDGPFHQQHYHVARSPNNPHPHVSYPAHLLDFDAYPDPPIVSPMPVNEWTTPAPDGYCMRLVERVIAHMLRERSVPLPPWQSLPLLRLLERRAESVRPALAESGLWDELWAGVSHSRRESEVRAAEARRLARGAGEFVRMDNSGDEEQEWAVWSSGMQQDDGAMQKPNIEAFNRRLGERMRQKELQNYYNGVAI